MKTTSTVGRSLQVLLLAMCGLLFYVGVLVLLGVAGAYVLSASAHAQSLPEEGTWTTTGSLTEARKGHTATLLQDGRVLVVGGTGSVTAELYDPATGNWTSAGHLVNPRGAHTATLLTSGKVLVVSGATAEIFDPATVAWIPTGAPSLERFSHAAALLADGRVLVAGGSSAGAPRVAAEIYDPETGRWSATGPLAVGRYGHTMTTLLDGRVLAAGGVADDFSGTETDVAEVYDPIAATWTSAGSLSTPVSGHAATLLRDGRVLLSGGELNSYPGGYASATSLDKTQLFDPSTNSWSDAARLAGSRTSHTATLLADGRVLVTGGFRWYGSYPPGLKTTDIASAEVFDGTKWTSAGGLASARYEHTATLLPNGEVLIAGGSARPQSAEVWLDTAQLYTSSSDYTPPVTIDATFTGSWYDPTQSGHGLMLEVLPGNVLLALWFTFDAAGKQAWFGGVGTYSGNVATLSGVSLPRGGKWVPTFDANAIVQNPWGTLTFTFSDRDHGRVDFASTLGFGTGSMNLTRLTRIAGAAPSALASPIGPPVSVVTDPTGNVYFSSAPDRIFKVDAQGGLTGIAGTGTPGYSGDGGAAAHAQMNFPLSYPELVHDPVDFTPLVGGLARDGSKNLYIADAYNNRVRRIDPNGVITTVAGDGSPAAVYWPQGVALDPAGNLYVTSAWGPLFRVAPNGAMQMLAGGNCGPGYLGPGLCVPDQIAIDGNGNLFVPDGYCRVRKVSPGPVFVTVAGAEKTPSNGSAFTCGYSGDGGPALDAALSIPYGVAVDPAGVLYIADTGNNCVRKVDNGIITTIAGICDPVQGGFSGDGGAATQARLNQPFAVAVDANRNVYIADTYNNRVRRVSAAGVITTVAGNGSAIDAPASAAIGPAFTGNWYNPAQGGHGLMLEVLPGNQLLALWFAFSPSGEQSWFGGVGTYSGNRATITGVAVPAGGKWIPDFDANALTRNAWGTLTFTFSDCNHGRVDYSSTYDGYGSGSMQLTRLTLPQGLACP